MTTFDQFDLPAPLMKALEKMGYTAPTPVQEQAIPLALQGRDILGSAQTGTGKTAAFGIPLVNHLITNPRSTALVMTPTRELAMQVIDILQQLLLKNPTIKTALLIGGESMPAQEALLRMQPRLIVGTPGRINDFLGRGRLLLNRVGFLVLDETDRMLDMGFEDQIESILKFMPGQRQTLLFSATLPPYIVKLSEKYLIDPERIAVGSTTNPVARIKQEVAHVDKRQRYTRLKQELKQREGSVIIFVNRKRDADDLHDRLHRDGFSANAIHGDLKQSQRQKVIDDFREQRMRILVATDIAARGLDIAHIEHVINYGLPMAQEDYIHRIGRTGRAGAEGNALCLITKDDEQQWARIRKMMGSEAKIVDAGSPGEAEAPKKAEKAEKPEAVKAEKAENPARSRPERAAKSEASDAPRPAADVKKPANRNEKQAAEPAAAESDDGGSFQGLPGAIAL